VAGAGVALVTRKLIAAIQGKDVVRDLSKEGKKYEVCRRSRTTTLSVIAGHPRQHAERAGRSSKDRGLAPASVDARNKCGHDVTGVRRYPERPKRQIANRYLSPSRA
jgi:hypothetical protein